uniref:Zn(2)-C6 fungal-type domain-containing protein n=2 Tax=Kalmanozyma brasiliensis (strain GHG001) TaxID=1365824 RepID=V5EF59_KALBG
MGAFTSRDAYPSDQFGHARYPPVASAHDARPWPEMRRYSDGPSRPSTSTSSDPAFPANKSTLPSRKRKKQFKYMLELEAADASKPANDDAEKDELDADGMDTIDTAGGIDSVPQRKESRKKVKKACIFCKRSHMPCEEARPCKRCVKRGISHLCKDAEPASASGNASSKAKSEETRQAARAKQRKGSKDALRTNTDQALDNESGSDSESLASSSAASSFHRRSYDMNVMPGAAARDPDYRPTMPVSMLCSPAGAELARRPAKRAASPGVSQKEQEDAWNRTMDPSTQTKMKQMLEAGNAARDLSDVFGEIPTSLLMTPAQASLPRGQSILRPASAELTSSPPRNDGSEREQRLKRSLSMTLTTTPHEVDEAGFKLPRRPRHLLQEEAATTSELRGGPPTYSYTYGYAKLARWMHTRFSRESCEQVDQALSVIRPKLMALSRSLPEAELIGVEDSFYQLLEFYTANVMETIPIPMILARRTGEIYAANSHACNLMQLPPSIFEGGQICHYQLVSEKDAVNMWGKYAKEARGELDSAPSQTVMLEVDRSLLLFDKPGFDPCTGELLGDGSGRCEDGSAAVIRRKVIVTFEAKMSKHGLPFMVTGFIVPIPEED